MTDPPDAVATVDSSARHALEPMDPALKSVQPGGGVIVHAELFWGRLRRWYLRKFRSGYVTRMAESRRGPNPEQFDVLDPRDLKFIQNQVDCFWSPQDDPFAWRERIPFARAGLAELLVFSALFFGTAVVAGVSAARVEGLASVFWGLLCAAATVVGLLIVWFFRDPVRTIPTGNRLVVSPADGKVVTVETVEDDEFIGGRAVLIGIFLSIFNVHINRSPVAARVIGMKYDPGKYLNALRPESARENERLSVRLEECAVPHRRMIVRQIAGAIARRIVCGLKPGDDLHRGARFGMIKLGSRTELLLPYEEGLQITVSVGDKVRAGSSVLARYVGDTLEAESDFR